MKQRLNDLGSIVNTFPWEDKQFYGAWLAQTYCFVKHSTHLIALAAAHCPPGDRFHRRFADHLADEVGHEKLLINDMKFLGFDPTSVKEFASTAGIYQAQYYWITQKNPLAFFGYVLALEASAVQFGPELCERVKQAHSNRCTSFLHVHSVEDVQHVEKGYEQLSEIPDEVAPFVIESMDQTFSRYKQLLNECQQFSMQMRKAS